MEYLILIIALAAGVVLGMYTVRPKSGGVMTPNRSRETKQSAEKQQNLKKVLALFDTKDQVTNDDVEHGLNVSDATATNYLQELEDAGAIKQVGEQGRYVHYERIR